MDLDLDKLYYRFKKEPIQILHEEIYEESQFAKDMNKYFCLGQASLLNIIKEGFKDDKAYSKEYIFEVIECLSKSNKTVEEYYKRL